MKRSIELLEVDALKPAVRNPKDHDLGELMTSIERFGFVDAVVLDERSGRLVAGHGRVEALQAMKKDGKPAPRGVTVDDDGRWLLPVQRGWSSRDDREAEAFIVASNRLVEVGGWDSNALTELLADLAKSGADALSGIGYDADDLQRLVGMFDADFPDLPTGDRHSLRQATFTLSEAQFQLIQQAMKLAGSAPDGTGNENSNGNALANVARAFLGGRA